ncbi:MAG: site-specific integrase [Selenomonadaceae bacterium]|nr:site-specific integrase [Selenomonadaceae bacterium]
MRLFVKYAVYPAQLISLNPAAYIEVPKNAPQNVVERHIITHKHFATLLEKYPFGTPYYIPLLLLYHTGARLGEVLGLIWSDVNFETKRITLRQQITYISKRGHFFTTLKTKSSNRYIIVDDFLLGELKRWQNRDGKLCSQKIIPSRQKNYRSEICERFFVCRKSLRIKHFALRIMMSLRSLRAVFCLSKIIAH